MDIPERTERDATDAGIADLVRKWYWSPLAFANDIIPFGEIGTPFGKWNRLHSWIEDLLIEFEQILRARYEASPDPRNPRLGNVGIAVGSGHGTGKSTALIPIVNSWALFTRPFTTGIVTAPQEDQLKARAWGDIRAMFEAVPILKRHFATSNKRSKHTLSLIHI